MHLLKTSQFIVENISHSGGNFYVLLYGDYGSGKTTLVKEIAKLIDIQEKVKSPSYGYLNEYEIKLGRFNKFIHIDLWRIPDTESLNLVLSEIPEKESIIAIEWPNKLPDEFVSEIEHGIEVRSRVKGDEHIYDTAIINNGS